MRKILNKLSVPVAASLAVTLDHAARQKSRGLLTMDDGSEAALLLERGSTLQHGDRLLTDDGLVVLIQAALEGLSVVTAKAPLELARAAYHLGNRHIALQIEALRLAYLHDHVLDAMLRELGFQVSFAAERFDPESGAYGHGHAHLSHPASHGHVHTHDHDHDHGHDPTHDPGHDPTHDPDSDPQPGSPRRALALP